MDFLLELIFEIIFEGSLEITKNQKISKWIRYPLLLLILIFFTTIILMLFLLSIFIYQENKMISIFFLLLVIYLLVSIYKKFKYFFALKNNKTKKD